ncbi:hypothetical protein [Duncaniella dubosii]|jgi:hypothetical protein|nr:hypothetical protein [Duncaniella dubosii]
MAKRLDYEYCKAASCRGSAQLGREDFEQIMENRKKKADIYGD